LVFPSTSFHQCCTLIYLPLKILATESIIRHLT
jgi:hypothetical protein